MISSSAVGVVLTENHGIVGNFRVLSRYVQHRAIHTVSIERIIDEVLHILAILSLIDYLNSLKAAIIDVGFLKHLNSSVGIVNIKLFVMTSYFLIQYQRFGVSRIVPCRPVETLSEACSVRSIKVRNLCVDTFAIFPLSLVDPILSIDPSKLAIQIINLEGVSILNECLAAIRIYNLSFIWLQVNSVRAVGETNSKLWRCLNLDFMICVIPLMIFIRVIVGIEGIEHAELIPLIGTIRESNF